jgi:predicted ATPase
MRREGEATLEHVQASLVLSTEYDFPYLTALGTVLQGWELTRRAQVAAGITQMRQGLAALRTMGAEVLRPFLLALLADACAWDGQIKVGLGVLNKALMTAEQHTERFYTAELHRLKGELILRYVADARTTCQSLLQTEAEACFQNALHLAQRQTAKLLELRAAMSLARLWQQQDKRTAARELLAPIYGWFTEGFDTADLQECKGLLDTLG